MLSDDQYSPKTKKKIMPRMSILIPAVLVCALGYVFFFAPAFISNKSKENSGSGNLAQNSAAQNGNQTNSLVGGGY